MASTLRDHSKTIFHAMCCLIAASGRISEVTVGVAYFQLSKIGSPPPPADFAKRVAAVAQEKQKKGVFESALDLQVLLAKVREDSLANAALPLIKTVAECSSLPGKLERDIFHLFLATLNGEESLKSGPVAPTEPFSISDVQAKAYAMAVVQQLQIPPLIYSSHQRQAEQMVVAPVDHEEHSQRECLRSASALVDAEHIPEVYRPRVIHFVLERLRGSKLRQENTAECRCIKCGRPYWCDLSAAIRGVICPHCGKHQRATGDWRRPAPATGPQQRSALPYSNTGGPISVRACVTKKGHMRKAHTRARPRRRK